MDDSRDRDAVAEDYRNARDRGDSQAMRRYQNQEACFVLLAILERLAADERSFVHAVALKGGILMAGELQSARSSADIDATTGRGKRIDPDKVVADLRQAGRQFNVRLDGDPERTPGGLVVRFRFDSLADGGTAKLEISVREDLVFAVRDAYFDVTALGLRPFVLPAVARVELVAEKLRTLVQRAQPRDLFDLFVQLAESGWHLDPGELRKAVDVKLALTRNKRWKPGLWRLNLPEIHEAWTLTLPAWIEPDRLPDVEESTAVVAEELRRLKLD